MSMKVRPDYISPLTMHSRNAALKPGRPAARQADKVSKLQTKQQQLQNQVLLLKASGTDSAGASAETQKALEAALKEVSAKLRTAKSGTAQQIEPAALAAQLSNLRPGRDLYEPEKAPVASPGIYQVEQGRRISFLPYSEG